MAEHEFHYPESMMANELLHCPCEVWLLSQEAGHCPLDRFAMLQQCQYVTHALKNSLQLVIPTF
jgi:hypothetical protein